MKILIVFLFIVCYLAGFTGGLQLWSQQPAELLMNYDFSDAGAVDLTGNTVMHLRKGAEIFSDPDRGNVLRFNAQEKSYSVVDQQVLDRDTFTIAFWFYWEDAGATSWHQLFEISNLNTGSNIYLTSANGWDNALSFFSDCKEYSGFEGVRGGQIPKNEWVHLAVTLCGKEVGLFVNGENTGSGIMMFTPSVIHADSLLFGGNPYRSDDYYITARYDDIRVYNMALVSNQVETVIAGEEIPGAVDPQTNWETSGNIIQLTVDLQDTRQTISNFGASDGWNTDIIGKYWPLEKKEKIAELIFSTEKDGFGDPKGIGLSSWRFNIGAGTAEQGASSRISNEYRRTEGFLNMDGTYNWDKQAGQRWFLEKAAHSYQVHHLIGWQNSPPVRYTYNNLGFREYGTDMSTILKPEYFDDFGHFLADVTEHFDNEGIHFDYISPLNEPQYPWSPSYTGGTVTQEGTPWTNQNIHDVVTAISEVFSERNIDTRLFIPEAGNIGHLLRGSGHANNQLYQFWNPASTLSLTSEYAFSGIVSYHSYWNDFGDHLVDERIDLRNRADQLDPVPELWQTEYSMLGGGYREGYPEAHLLSEMECGLALAKVMMADLNIAETSGWQWWTMFEWGKFGGETRFCLIEAFTNNERTDGVYHPNKLFYTLGQFSHFIRPGMIRLGIQRSDNVSLYLESSNLSFSAYTNDSEDKLVLIAVNHTPYSREVSLSLKNAENRVPGNISLYLTDKYHNLQKPEKVFNPGQIIIPAHSVATITSDILPGTSEMGKVAVGEDIHVYYSRLSDEIVVESQTGMNWEEFSVYNLCGKKLLQIAGQGDGREQRIPAGNLRDGIYVVLTAGVLHNQASKVYVFRNHQ
jgi:O-glycosyl hydrolase